MERPEGQRLSEPIYLRLGEKKVTTESDIKGLEALEEAAAVAAATGTPEETEALRPMAAVEVAG